MVEAKGAKKYPRGYEHGPYLTVTMALPPTLQALSIGSASAPHTLEFYVRGNPVSADAARLSLYVATHS